MILFVLFISELSIYIYFSTTKQIYLDKHPSKKGWVLKYIFSFQFWLFLVKCIFLGKPKSSFPIIPLLMSILRFCFFIFPRDLYLTFHKNAQVAIPWCKAILSQSLFSWWYIVIRTVALLFWLLTSTNGFDQTCLCSERVQDVPRLLLPTSNLPRDFSNSPLHTQTLPRP